MHHVSTLILSSTTVFNIFKFRARLFAKNKHVFRTSKCVNNIFFQKTLVHALYVNVTKTCLENFFVNKKGF